MKNRAIEAWRFVVAVIIIIYHFKRYDPNLGYLPFMGGYLGNIFFFVLGGFLLMRHFERTEQNRAEQNRTSTPERKAFQYLKKRYVQVFSHHVFSWLLVAAVFICCGKRTLKEIVIKGIWEFFLVSLTGMGGTYRVNGTIWYLSAFLIASFFIYYLLLKSKERFLYLIGPVSIFIILAHFYNDKKALAYTVQYYFLFDAGVWEAFACMAYGCICYEIFLKIKRDYSNCFKFKSVRVSATIFEVCGFGYSFYYMWYGVQEKDFIMLFLFGLLFISVFSESSYLTQVLNNKLSYYCGKITFAMYLNQLIIINFVSWKLPGYPFWPMILCVLAVIIVFSIFSTWFVKKLSDAIQSVSVRWYNNLKTNDGSN